MLIKEYKLKYFLFICIISPREILIGYWSFIVIIVNFFNFNDEFSSKKQIYTCKNDNRNR